MISSLPSVQVDGGGGTVQILDEQLAVLDPLVQVQFQGPEPETAEGEPVVHKAEVE